MQAVAPKAFITERQNEVYQWIRDKYAERGFGAGVREISKAFGFASPGAAYCHLHVLEKRGLVTRTPGRANSIIPVEV